MSTEQKEWSILNVKIPAELQRAVQVAHRSWKCPAGYSCQKEPVVVGGLEPGKKPFAVCSRRDICYGELFKAIDEIVKPG